MKPYSPKCHFRREWRTFVRLSGLSAKTLRFLLFLEHHHQRRPTHALELVLGVSHGFPRSSRWRTLGLTLDRLRLLRIALERHRCLVLHLDTFGGGIPF